MNSPNAVFSVTAMQILNAEEDLRIDAIRELRRFAVHTDQSWDQEPNKVSLLFHLFEPALLELFVTQLQNEASARTNCDHFRSPGSLSVYPEVHVPKDCHAEFKGFLGEVMKGGGCVKASSGDPKWKCEMTDHRGRKKTVTFHPSKDWSGEKLKELEAAKPGTDPQRDPAKKSLLEEIDPAKDCNYAGNVVKKSEVLDGKVKKLKCVKPACGSTDKKFKETRTNKFTSCGPVFCQGSSKKGAEPMCVRAEKGSSKLCLLAANKAEKANGTKYWQECTKHLEENTLALSQMVKYANAVCKDFFGPRAKEARAKDEGNLFGGCKSLHARLESVSKQASGNRKLRPILDEYKGLGTK